VFELAVVGLDRVVGVLFDVVPRRGHQLVEGGRVYRCGVGDDLGRGPRDERRGDRIGGAVTAAGLDATNVATLEPPPLTR
jgi:hypothetical protein